MDPVINADVDDLNGFEESAGPPGRWARVVAWLVRPLVPLANRAARHRYEVEAARLAHKLTAAERKLRRADVERDAAVQEKETLAAMHARVIAMLAKDTAIFNATTRGVADR